MLSAIRAIVLGRAETETTTSDSIHEFEVFRKTSFEKMACCNTTSKSKITGKIPKWILRSVGSSYSLDARGHTGYSSRAVISCAAYKVNRLDTILGNESRRMEAISN